MKRKSKIAIIEILLIGAVFACNLPGAAKTPAADDQAATAVEATLMEGILGGADTPVAVTFSPIPRNPSKIPTIETTASSTVTPTYSVPMLVVREKTNCRAGPGQDYEIVATYLPNAKMEIIGNYGIANYWLVKSPDSPKGQCWLWGEFVEVSGSYWAVPSVTPPPTAAPRPPTAPTFQSWNFQCEYNGVNLNLTVTLTWADKSNNETGFRIFRDGSLIADLPANSTVYIDSTTVNSGQSVIYRVEVYNPAGTAGNNAGAISCS